MEKECSIYKVVYKKIEPIATKYGLEITIYGEDLDMIQDRFEQTLVDLELDTDVKYKIWQIERK